MRRFRVPEIVLGIGIGVLLSLFAAGIGSYQAEHCEQAHQNQAGKPNLHDVNPTSHKSANRDQEIAKQHQHPPFFGCGAAGLLRSAIGFMDSHEGFFVGSFTLVLAFFTFWLVRATVGLRESTDRLWEAGERQISTIQRAFVFGRELDANVTFQRSGVGLYVSCVAAKVWENSGTTPAMNVSIRENYGAFPGEIPGGFEFPDNPNNPRETIVLGPKAHIVSRGIHIAPDDLHSAIDGKVRLFMWGWAEYDDVFEGTPRHRTEFCNELIPDGFEVPIERREIRSRVYGRHNGADASCYRGVQTPRAK